MANPVKNDDGLWEATHEDGSVTIHKTRKEGRDKIQEMKETVVLESEQEEVEEIEEPVQEEEVETWEDSIYEAVNRLSYKLSDNVRKISKEVTYNQIEILLKLSEDDLVNQRQVQDSMNCTDANVSHALGKLEDNGYVKRARNPHDRREVDISLTAKGKKIRKELIKGRDEILTDSFRNLNDKDMKALSKLLVKVKV